MKGVVYTKYGPPDVLQLKEIERPIPKDNEVLIKVCAAEVTKADCELRSFHFPVKWFWLPLRMAMGLTKPKKQILGGYFAGEVESVGKDVSNFKKGDQIFGTTKLRLGAYGEYMCLPASYTLVPKPCTMSFEEAAAVPLGGLNALHFLRKANIRKGEKEEELLTLKKMIEEGKIKPIVDKIYPIEQAVEAHRRVEAEQRLGPVVISVGKSYKP